MSYVFLDIYCITIDWQDLYFIEVATTIIIDFNHHQLIPKAISIFCISLFSPLLRLGSVIPSRSKATTVPTISVRH